MNILRFIRRAEPPVIPPSLADCGRILAEHRCLQTRERVKARARLMRAEMGLEPLRALEGRR